ncbi:MAG: acetyl-CoA carboxylase, biotin carboxylase subunit [Chloroflexota bacterium]|nr:acetyl-CoA carboxylase, biotin carboxylase subunit [Chloroflexota bacterium]
MALRRVLVANRGEIARRVIRACHDEGLEAVAVHSEIDAGAPFVAEADQAVPIGPGPAPRSYLDVAALLEAARRTGADAVHPGYGFLSESARFAAAVAAAGLTWVGPPAEVIAAMGDKVAARTAMRAAGVPVVPGTDSALDPDEDIAAAAAAVGFPLMVKARAGGGGIGMQRVDDPTALQRAVATARQRAAAAFGDGGVFLERFVDRPRHVEVQVLADAHGNAVHLGERECSVQRRHQKVIEESPSCALDAGLRERMAEAALRAVAAIGYRNAGTVEFLVDAAGAFHFLEMNTRLQVEHPVTEMRTGVDIVRLQLRIAAGEPLGLTQDGVTFDGHAIEMRVYAEDPYRMLPSPGTITAWREPSGPGIRVDSGVVEGSVVSHLYDPLLAKLIVHAPTREAALDLALDAVDGFRVEGVRTNLALHRHVLTSAPFRAGDYTTALLEVIGPVPRPVPSG